MLTGSGIPQRSPITRLCNSGACSQFGAARQSCDETGQRFSDAAGGFGSAFLRSLQPQKSPIMTSRTVVVIAVLIISVRSPEPHSDLE